MYMTVYSFTMEDDSELIKYEYSWIGVTNVRDYENLVFNVRDYEMAAVDCYSI